MEPVRNRDGSHAANTHTAPPQSSVCVQLPSSDVPLAFGNLTDIPRSMWPDLVAFNKRAPKPNLSYFASSGLIDLYLSVVLTIGYVPDVPL